MCGPATSGVPHTYSPEEDYNIGSYCFSGTATVSVPYTCSPEKE